MAVTVTTYRLRGGQVRPSVGCASGEIPNFFAQTFGVDKIISDIYEAKTEILASSDMQGQKPGDVEDSTYRETTYTTASYQGRPLRTTDGDLVFSATEEHVHEFVDEEIILGS